MLSKKRPTQADVAVRANVSQAMVSYVINNSTSVTIPDETRQRILTAMEDLGYVPNITARRLRSSKTYTVAGVIPDITNPFYPAFERGIQDTANQFGYDLVMYNTDGTEERERKCVESLLQGRVEESSPSSSTCAPLISSPSSSSISPSCVLKQCAKLPANAA